MIDFNVGDNVAVKLSDDQTVVFLVLKKLKTHIEGISANAIDDGDIPPFEFTEDSVIANLGEHPQAGNVYGFYLEPFYNVEHHDIGKVAYFVSEDDFKKKDFRKALDNCVDDIEKYRLNSVLPFQVDFRPAKGKMAGSYKAMRTGDDIITLRNVGIDSSDFDYTLMHELGHALYARLFVKSERATWIKEYHNCVSIYEYTSKDLKSLLKDLNSNTFMTVTEFKKTLDESNLILLKHILKYIRVQHSLSLQDLDQLCLDEAGNLNNIWPATILEVSEIDTVLTDYAKKSVQEFWCEAFAHYMVGLDLPKNLKKLVKVTLAALADRPSSKGD